MTRTERVRNRLWEWWDATIEDEYATERSPEWWADKFQELYALAVRETVDGVTLW